MSKKLLFTILSSCVLCLTSGYSQYTTTYKDHNGNIVGTSETEDRSTIYGRPVEPAKYLPPIPTELLIAGAQYKQKKMEEMFAFLDQSFKTLAYQTKILDDCNPTQSTMIKKSVSNIKSQVTGLSANSIYESWGKISDYLNYLIGFTGEYVEKCGKTTQLSAQDLKADMTHALLKVEVLDNKKKPQVNQTVSFISLKDGKEFGGTTNTEGKFSILIPPDQKYKVKYKIFTSEKSDLVLEMPAAPGPYTFEYTITATPPRTFTLDNVFFDSGKSTLRAESNKELNELAEYMGLKPTLVIEIGGHTDNVGAPDANQKLSEDRANAVVEYLKKKGIAAARLTAKGYGDTKPVADNTSAAGKQKNRRTEVKIISE